MLCITTALLACHLGVSRAKHSTGTTGGPRIGEPLSQGPPLLSAHFSALEVAQVSLHELRRLCRPQVSSVACSTASPARLALLDVYCT